MKEHEEELGEMFRGINSLLKGEAVVPSLFNDDGQVDDPFVDRYRLGYKRRFLNLYLIGFRRQVSVKTDSSELASTLRADFFAKIDREAEQHLKKGAHGLADECKRYTLDDLVEEADRNIGKLERNLSNYHHESPTYKQMQVDIRKLEIMRNAALDVEDTS